MTGTRAELRTVRARWLRLRAKVRGLEAQLVAAQHELRRDARRSDDPQFAVLVERLAAERRALRTLGTQLEARLRALEPVVRAAEAATVDACAASARRGNPP